MPNNRPSAEIPRGLIVPTITPLVSQDRLDVAALERLIDRVVSGGVHGLFLLGTCGEGPSLGERIKREVVERVCRQVAGRTAVLVCVTHSSAAESTALAAHADDCGADAVVLASPFYFPLTQAELQGYIERRVAEISLPVLLYNYPGMTKVEFEPDTVRRLLDVPQIVGFKDTSGDIDYFQKIRRVSQDRPGWRLYMGPEQLLVESLKMGGDGGVAGGANILPELLVHIFEAAEAHDADRLGPLLKKAATLAEIFKCGEGGAAAVRGLKAALAALGIGNGRPADPLLPATDAQRDRIAGILQELGA